MTRETHKVSLGSQKRSCRVVGLHERHGGPNQNSIIVEVLNGCQISCHLNHALSNIVNALNDATIQTRLDEIIIRQQGTPVVYLCIMQSLKGTMRHAER